MMSARIFRLTLTVISALTLSIAMALQLYASTDATKQHASTEAQHKQHTGEHVFMENCSRCHMPPMSISPRITGTVVMHMRVRARLSRKDQQLLLRYLAP
jgi:cytochrome c5